jgi:hypothetical protein
MSRRCLQVCTAVVAAVLTTGATRGAVIQSHPGDFALFAFGTLEMKSGSAARGSIGAAGAMTLRNDATVLHDAYTASSFRGRHRVSIGGRLVAGDSISVRNDGSFGRVDAAGAIRFGHRTTTGDVHAGGTVRFGNDSISGAILDQTTSHDTWDPTPNLLTDPRIEFSGGTNVRLEHGEQIVLAPGLFGDARTGNDVTIRLTAGEYVFTSLDLGHRVDFLADTSAGDVVIRILGDVAANDDITIERDGFGLVTLLALGDMTFGPRADLDASIGALAGGNVRLGDDSAVEGSVYAAGDLRLGRRSTVEGRQPLPNASRIPTPSAATAMLISGAAWSAARRRRRWPTPSLPI